MTIASFINPWQRGVIDRILTHCGLSSRAPPSEVRAPPPQPIRERTSHATMPEHARSAESSISTSRSTPCIAGTFD